MKKLELNLYVDLTELNPTVDLGMTNHDIYMSHDQKEGEIGSRGPPLNPKNSRKKVLTSAKRVC